MDHRRDVPRRSVRRELACNGLRDGARSRRSLRRKERSRALEESGAVRRSELHGALEHFLCALGVTTTKEDVAEPAIYVSIARCETTRSDEHLLRSLMKGAVAR